MGYTKVRVRIPNPTDEKRFLETEILVDTGAAYTVISSKRLKELGMESAERMVFYSIGNEKLIRDVGCR